MKLFRVLVVLLFALSFIPFSSADSTGGDKPNTTKAPEGRSRITGKVINQRGKGMPNLLVKLMIPRGMKNNFPTTQQLKGGKNPYIEGNTDADGNFAFEKLPAGEYSVVSELDGVGRGKIDLTLGENQTYPVQVLLKARRGEKQ